MRKGIVVLSILLLVAVGGWLRLEGADWNQVRLRENAGMRLPQDEAVFDKKARLILERREQSLTALSSIPARQNRSNLPGYPLFLAACYVVFGYGESPPLAQIQLIQTMLDLSTALLLFAAVRFLLDLRLAAWTVSALYIVHPAFISASAHLSADTVKGFINVLILCCFILFFRSGEHSPLTGLLCGTAFAIGIMLHPPVFPFLLLFIGLGGLRCFYTRRNVKPYLLALFCSTLLLSPWWLSRLNAPDRSTVIVSQTKQAILPFKEEIACFVWEKA